MAEYRKQVARLGVPNDTQQSLSRIDNSIQRSTTMALESERLGHDTIDDLAIQRERLSGARDRLEEANREIGQSELRSIPDSATNFFDDFFQPKIFFFCKNDFFGQKIFIY